MIPGEAERLLQEYRQNQELVQNIGAHYYQIIYPVQLRHHEKMGISTREVSVSKVIKLFLRTISNERKSIRNFSFIENWYILWCRNFVTFSRSKAYRIFFFLSRIYKLYSIETFWRFEDFAMNFVTFFDNRKPIEFSLQNRYIDRYIS